MKRYELMPTDGRKSFYKKAIVEINGNTETLYSYETPIISRNTKTGELKKTMERMDSDNRPAYQSLLWIE